MTESTGPRRRMRADARRRQLLDVAGRVVATEGGAATMDSIAAAAGVTKPLLYRHFGDKTGLMVALAERHTTAILETVVQALAKPGTVRTRTAATIGAYLAYIETDPQLYRLVTRTDDDSPAAAAIIRRFLATIGDQIALAIAADFELDGPDGALATSWGHAIVGMVHTAGDMWLERRHVTREVLIEHLTGLLMGTYVELAAERDRRHGW